VVSNERQIRFNQGNNRRRTPYTHINKPVFTGKEHSRDDGRGGTLVTKNGEKKIRKGEKNRHRPPSLVGVGVGGGNAGRGGTGLEKLQKNVLHGRETERMGGIN